MTKAERQPTINDVARLAGVSKKTVSRVINRSPHLKKDTRDKVERAIVDLGYVPNPQARALALRRNFLLCLLHDNPNAQTVLSFQEGVLDTIRETEFALVVRPVDRHSPQMLEDIRHFLERQRPFGALILPPISENDGIAQVCRDLGVGYVRMGSAALDDHRHHVESNDREAVSHAVDYLIELGHSHIGLIAGPEGFRSSVERGGGFLDAMEKSGLAVPTDRIASGGYTFESGLKAADRLLEVEPRPTAVFASNDEMAAGALHAARIRGLSVPEDLSIIGFDDSAIAAHIWPPLTTVRWPIVSMARSAARKLIYPDEADEAPSRFISDIVRRGSVGPPPR